MKHVAAMIDSEARWTVTAYACVYVCIGVCVCVCVGIHSWMRLKIQHR